MFLAFCSLVARAAEWRKTYNVAGNPELSVDTNDGDVRIRASDRKDIEVLVVIIGYKIGSSGVRVTEY